MRRLRLLIPFVMRELREQYAGSWLGILWTVIQPALLILLFWWVFSAILRIRIPVEVAGDLPFLVFLLAGLLPWFAFQEGVMKGTGSLIAHRDVIKKVAFPVKIFPIAALSAGFIIHLCGFILFISVFFIWQGMAWLTLLALVLLLGLQWLLMAGLVLGLSALTVYIRDIQQVVNALMPAMFYTAPILYPLALVPEHLRWLLLINPFTPYAQSYQNVVLLGQWPALHTWLVLLTVAALAFGLGYALFRRLQNGFADVL